MSTSLADIVDVGALVKVVWVSLTAGIGVTTAFSFAVFGFARGRDAQRDGTTAGALPFFAITVLGLAACAWALWRGYDFIVHKS